MATNIGPKIGLDGEAEFRKNLQQIGQQLKTLGTEMKAVTSAFTDNDKSQEALSAQASVLNRQLTLQEQRLSEIQRALDYAKANYAENSNEVQRWQQAMNNATAEVNTTRAQLSRLESEMNGADKAADGLADGMDDAGDAADDSASKFDAATVAIGNLAANAISAAVSAIGDLISSLLNLDEATEEYRAAQAKTGAAFEQAGHTARSAQIAYNDLFAILGQSDTAAEAAQQIALIADSAQQVEQWARLAAGVVGTFGDALQPETFYESANETLKLGEATGAYVQMLEGAGVNVDEFNKSLASCNTEQEKQELLLDTAESILGDAGDAYREYASEIIAANEAQAELDAVLSGIGAPISKAKTAIAKQLIPVLKDFVDSVDWDALAQSVADFVSAIIDNGPTILSVVSGIGAAFLAWKITSLVSSVVTAVGTLIPALTGATAAQTGLNTAMSLNPIGIIVTLIAGLVTALITLWNTNEGFREAVTTAWNSIKEIASTVFAAISNFFTVTIPNAIQECLNWFAQLPGRIGEFLSNAISSVASWAEEMASNAVRTGSSFLQNVIEFVSQLPSRIAEFLANIITNVASWVVEMATNAAKAAQDFGSKLLSGLESLPSKLIEVGRNIINGLVDGIVGSAKAVINAIGGVVNDAISWAKSLLGIASPSKVFADIGKNMALGLGVGWTDQMGQISRDIQRSIPTPTIETVNNAAAGMVNGLSAMSMPSFPQTIVLTLENGAEIARWLLPYNRMAARANPEVVSGV